MNVRYQSLILSKFSILVTTSPMIFVLTCVWHTLEDSFPIDEMVHEKVSDTFMFQKSILPNVPVFTWPTQTSNELLIVGLELEVT
jgi:hypothetical protein